MADLKVLVFAPVLGFMGGRFLRPRFPVLFWLVALAFLSGCWDSVAAGDWGSPVIAFTAGGVAGAFCPELAAAGAWAWRRYRARGASGAKADDPPPRPERPSGFTYGEGASRASDARDVPPPPPGPPPGAGRREPPEADPPPEPKRSAPPPPPSEVPDHLRPALATLGLPTDRRPTSAAVKKAYRDFAKRCHPDRKGGDHADVSRFVEGTKALDSLRAAGWA